MFYRPGTDPLPFQIDPFKALVSPRPIGWISTRDGAGRDNLAPYSFFNALADNPPMVMFSSVSKKPDRATKDALEGARESGVFCANIVSFALKDAMNVSSGPYEAGVDEFEKAGLEKAECQEIACPRVAASPASFECRLWKVIDLPGPHNVMAIGQVVGVHLDETILDGDRVDVTRYQPLSRLGYRDYAAVTETFRMMRPE